MALASIQKLTTEVELLMSPIGGGSGGEDS
jgi:hypothetical protein